MPTSVSGIKPDGHFDLARGHVTRVSTGVRVSEEGHFSKGRAHGPHKNIITRSHFTKTTCDNRQEIHKNSVKYFNLTTIKQIENVLRNRSHPLDICHNAEHAIGYSCFLP